MPSWMAVSIAGSFSPSFCWVGACRCQADHALLSARFCWCDSVPQGSRGSQWESDERTQQREVRGEREEEKPCGMRWKWVIWQALPPGQPVIKSNLPRCLHRSICQSFPVAFSHFLSVSPEITFLDQLWRLNSGRETQGARQSVLLLREEGGKLSCFVGTRFSGDGSWFFKMGPGFPKSLGPGNSQRVFQHVADALRLLLQKHSS